jgi:hypothetical protein
MPSVVTNRITSTTADVQSTQTWCPARDSCQTAGAESDVRLVYIAPPPIAGVERLHHGMSCLLEVLGGVMTWRGVAATDVSASETFAEFHPTLPGLETFLAAIAARRDIWIGLLHVLALCHGGPLVRICSLDELAREADSCNPAPRGDGEAQRQHNRLSIMDFRDASKTVEEFNSLRHGCLGDCRAGFLHDSNLVWQHRRKT